MYKKNHKERFKKVKRASAGIYQAPSFLTKLTVTCVSEQGVFQHGKKQFTKLYKVKQDMESREMFEILREYDIPFRFLRIYGESFLMLNMEAESMEAAIQEFERIETDLRGKTGKEIAAPCLFDDRMRCIHRFMMFGMKNCNISVQNYLDNTGGWKEDFFMSGYDFRQDNHTVDCENGSYRLFYVRKYPSMKYGIEKSGNLLKKLQMELEKSQAVIFQSNSFQPVSDQELSQWFQNSYLGVEAELLKLQKRNPKLYDIYMNGQDRADNRDYLLCGYYFLCKAEDGDFSNLYSRLEELEKVCRVRIEACTYNLQTMLQSISPAGTAENLSGRLMDKAQAGYLFDQEVYGQEETGDDITAENEILLEPIPEMGEEYLRKAFFEEEMKDSEQLGLELGTDYEAFIYKVDM